ncbi:MAG: hypothetical protein LBQ77_06695 [Treponema sp.]|jgi:hypothetical protein|nr:hypothetical protein [Treponema sp.]
MNFFRKDSFMWKAVPIIAACLGIVLTGCSANHDDEVLGDTTNLPAAFIGTKPSLNFFPALEARLTNKQSAVTDSTRIVVVHSTHISALSNTDKENIKKVFDRGGAVVVIEPIKNELDTLVAHLEHHHVGHHGEVAENRHFADIYAFNNKDEHYILHDIHPDTSGGTSESKPGTIKVVDDDTNETETVTLPDTLNDEDYGAIIDPLIKWLNENAANNSKKAVRATTLEDVTQIFESWSVTQSFPVTVSGELAHVALSKADTLTKGGSIQVVTQVYPLHAFDDQTAKGDYYVMHQEVTIPNGSWYNGKWTNKHGGVHVRLCGFFMKNFNINNTLTASGKTITVLDPNPQTTVGETSYTSGIEWNLTASVTGGQDQGQPKAEATIGGGVSVSNSKTRNIQDIEVHNTGDGKAAAWQLVFNNLTSYNSNISINEPSAPARSTQMFYTDWIWRVENVSDTATDQFTMTVNLSGTTWGSAKMYSSSADYGTKSFTPGIGAQTLQILRPNRVPTGALVLTNDSTGYISGITITRKSGDAGKASYSASESVPPKGTITLWLPSGTNTYEVQVKVGNATYTSKNTTISVNRAEKKNIYYGGGSPDF